MSLSTALNSAMTGITAASRSTSVVSDNLANALTEGYYRRTLNLSSNGAAAWGEHRVGAAHDRSRYSKERQVGRGNSCRELGHVQLLCTGF